MILLDLFSGIGGFHKGLVDAGFVLDKVYFSEIDKHAIANYRYNYEKSEHIGAVEHILDSGIERPNIITFGSPCQDFSIAGQRAGLDGERSSLIKYALTAISHFRPDIFIWENVKGTFSSNDSADFWGIIKAFANIGGYGIEWQLVNTKWILPQNRERIYLVGYFAKTFRNWKPIFPISENDEIFGKKTKTKERRTQTEISTTMKNNFGNKADDTYILCNKTAGCLTGGGHSGGLHRDMETISIIQRGHGFVNDNISNICPTIRGSAFEHNTYTISEPLHKHGEHREYNDFAPSISSRYGTGGDNIPYVNNIRRLTEIECERLQGFPDDWTKYGNYNGKISEIVKTQRYKMLGNAITCKMVELIGKKIIKNIN
jgi:DNA (cytosine-5)-methyltransferase 1